MSVLAECTPEEREAFIAIANGERTDQFDRNIIQSLMDKNLLGDHSGYTMIPAIVLKLWENEKAS